jgi:hypothetical protein
MNCYRVRFDNGKTAHICNQPDSETAIHSVASLYEALKPDFRYKRATAIKEKCDGGKK